MAPMDPSEYLNKWSELPCKYNKRDLLLYAVGIGCTELRYVYENDENFAAFPTYPIVLNFTGEDEDVVSFPSPAMMSTPFLPLDGVKVVLDGERSIEKMHPINPNGGDILIRSRYIGVHKRGSGASVESESVFIQDGKEVYKLISGSFFVGAKNFKDAGISNSEKVDIPTRKADKVLEMPTTLNQTHIYRLSGDYNPLHIEESFAQMSGFEKPIIHGLCSFGIAARAVLKAFAGDNEKAFKLMKARFAKTMLPGDTLIVEMWKEGDNKIIFQGRSKDTGGIILNNAYMLLNSGAKI